MGIWKLIACFTIGTWLGLYNWKTASGVAVSATASTAGVSRSTKLEFNDVGNLRKLPELSKEEAKTFDSDASAISLKSNSDVVDTLSGETKSEESLNLSPAVDNNIQSQGQPTSKSVSPDTRPSDSDGEISSPLHSDITLDHHDQALKENVRDSPMDASLKGFKDLSRIEPENGDEGVQNDVGEPAEDDVAESHAAGHISGNAAAKPSNAANILQNAIDTPQYAADTPQNAIDTPQNAIDTPQNAINTPQNAADTPQNAADTPQNAIDTPQNAIGTPQNAIGTPQYAADTPPNAAGMSGKAGTPLSATETPSYASIPDSDHKNHEDQVTVKNSADGLVINLRKRQKETWMVVSRTAASTNQKVPSKADLTLQTIRFPSGTKLATVVASENDTDAKDGVTSRLLVIKISGTGHLTGTSLEWSHSAQERRFRGDSGNDQLVLGEATQTDKTGSKVQMASKGPIFVESKESMDQFELRIIQDEDWDPLESQHLPNDISTSNNYKRNVSTSGESIRLTVEEIKAAKKDNEKHYRANLQLSRRLSDKVLKAFSSDQTSSQWTEWSSWEICSVTCGGNGQSERRRLCTSPPKDHQCEGSDVEIRPCSVPLHCPEPKKESVVPADGLLEWSTWSPCSVTCGVGSELQRRACHPAAEVSCLVQTRSRHCVLESCNPTAREAPLHVKEGYFAKLFCAYDRSQPSQGVYWVSPQGRKISPDTNDPRYMLRGNYLLVKHVEEFDRGTYHCVVLRQSGRVETGDATLVVDTCAQDNVCQNGGTCIDIAELYELHFSHFQCKCPDDFSGQLCEKEVNPVPLIILAVFLSCSTLGMIILCCVILCGRRKLKKGGVGDRDVDHEEEVQHVWTEGDHSLKPILTKQSLGLRRSSLGKRSTILSRKGWQASTDQFEPIPNRRDSHYSDNLYYDICDVDAEASMASPTHPENDVIIGDDVKDHSPVHSTQIGSDRKDSFIKYKKPSDGKFSNLNRDSSPVIFSGEERVPSHHSHLRVTSSTQQALRAELSRRQRRLGDDENRVVATKRVSFSDVTDAEPANQKDASTTSAEREDSEPIYTEPANLRQVHESENWSHSGRDSDVIVEDSSSNQYIDMSAPSDSNRFSASSDAAVLEPIVQGSNSIVTNPQHRNFATSTSTLGSDSDSHTATVTQKKSSLLEIAGMAPKKRRSQFENTPPDRVIATGMSPDPWVLNDNVDGSLGQGARVAPPSRPSPRRISTGLSPRAAPLVGRESKMANYIALSEDSSGNAAIDDVTTPGYHAFPDRRSNEAFPDSRPAQGFSSNLPAQGSPDSQPAPSFPGAVATLSPRAFQELTGELSARGLTPEKPASRNATRAFAPIPFNPKLRLFSNMGNIMNANNANNVAGPPEVRRSDEGQEPRRSDEGQEPRCSEEDEATTAWKTVVNTYNTCMESGVEDLGPNNRQEPALDEVIPKLHLDNLETEGVDTEEDLGTGCHGNIDCGSEENVPVEDEIEQSPMGMSVDDMSSWLGITRLET